MPKQPTVTSFEERVTASWLEDAQNVAARIAAEEGDPPGAGKVGDAEAVRLWGQVDPLVADDPIYFAEMLREQGIPEELVGRLVIVQEAPHLAESYAKPVPDEAMVDQLVRVAEYPFRWGLVIDWSDDPEEQVKRSDHLARLWQAQLPPAPEPAAPEQTEMMAPEQPAPVPMQPQPQMPPPPPAAPMPMMGGQ